MRASRGLTWGALLALASGGCMSGPLLDNPARVPAALPSTSASVSAECNPLYVFLGPSSYGLVFEKVLAVLSDYYDIHYANRYDGHIDTFPRTAPGLEQPWKPGSPDFRQRLLATLQSVRHFARVRILPADDGGFFVDVRVFKELEDVPRPIRATAGSATFRNDITVERELEVIDAAGSGETGWIPIGEDVKLEQVILRRLAKFDVRGIREVTPPAPAAPPAAPPR